MPFSGSAPTKTYSRSDGVRSGAAVNVQARTAGANDTAELADARENDLATAINSLWLRDGGNQPSANLPMNGFKFTGAAVASARDEFARASQAQDSSLIYGGVAGGTADALTLDLTPNITAYAAGQMFLFKASADNTSVDVTVNIDGVGAINVRKYDGATKPAVGEIRNGGMYLGMCDGTSLNLYGAISPNELAFAALTGAADRLAYFTGAGAMSLATLTSFARSILDDADAATVRTTLGLGTMAVEAAATYLTKADNLASVASAATAFANIKQAASDTATGAIEIAVQSEMETATDVARAVVPGRQHFHPGHPKAGGNFNGQSTPAFRTGDYGMGAITDNGNGDYTLAFDTAFSDTNYWLTACSRGGSSNGGRLVVSPWESDSKTTSAMQIRIGNVNDGSASDPAEAGVSFWGDYA